MKTFRKRIIIGAFGMVLPLAAIGQTQDGPGPGVRGGQPGIDLFPAPASVGASVGLSYFGPPPSDDNPSLVGPVQLLKSGVVDPIRGTITLPLYTDLLRILFRLPWHVPAQSAMQIIVRSYASLMQGE